MPRNLRTTNLDSNGRVDFIYDGGGVLMVRNQSGQILGAYTNGLVGAISKRNASNEYGYLMKDGLGTIRNIVDADKDIKMTYAYDIFGAIREAIGQDPIGIPQTFTGKELDTDSGLHYFGARYYDSAIGRFITADTWTWGPDNSQGARLSLGGSVVVAMGSRHPVLLNPYSYSLNNPINLTDPSGHVIFGPLLVLFGILLFVFLIAFVINRITGGNLFTKAVETGGGEAVPIPGYGLVTVEGLEINRAAFTNLHTHIQLETAGLDIDETIRLDSLYQANKPAEYIKYYLETVVPKIDSIMEGGCQW